MTIADQPILIMAEHVWRDARKFCIDKGIYDEVPELHVGLMESLDGFLCVEKGIAWDAEDYWRKNHDAPKLRTHDLTLLNQFKEASCKYTKNDIEQYLKRRKPDLTL